MPGTDAGGVRLELARWPGRALLLALGQVALLFAAGEFLARTPWIRDRLPPPSMGFNPVFDAKVAALDRLLAEGRPPECIALGTSTTMWGFDPDAVKSATRAAGRELRCFNLGLPGESMTTAIAAGAYVASRVVPRVFLVGECFDLNWEVERPLRTWPAHRTVEPSWEGALIERSVAYRYLLLGRELLFTDFRRRTLKNLSAYGFAPAARRRSQPVGRFLPQEPGGRMQPALPWLARLGALGAPVVLFDMPPHPAIRRLLAARPGGKGAGVQRATRRGHLVLSPADDLLRDEHYTDAAHLQAEGARVFSLWLGAELVRRGALP